MDACGCEALAILCYLLTRGADPKAVDAKSRSLFDIVQDSKLRPILERFIMLGRYALSLALGQIIGLGS